MEPEALVPKLDAVKKITPRAKTGYTNVAFQMMGIPRLRLPSRNWMIFWTVLAAFGGGAAYDKYEQVQLRKKYMEALAPLGQLPMPIDAMPRRVTIFIAPPPSDFLEESLRVFRRFVKPLLNSAAIDFDIVSEQRQGEIRYRVAEDIRSVRRKYRDQLEELVRTPALDKPLETEFIKPNSVFHWSDNSKSANNAKVYDEDGSEVSSKLTKILSPLSVLGVNYKSQVSKDITDLKSEDINIEHPEQKGGVICIGRGAYKEYITGVNEGLLGPLDPPPMTEELEIDTLKEEDEKKDTDEESDVPKIKVPLPYIKQSEYSKNELAPELDLSQQLYFKKNDPVYFQQPVLVLRSFSLVGFLKIPIRIYRFYQKRTQLQYYHSSTVDLIENKISKFDVTKDLDLLKEEETDWPSKWVKEGKEKQSLWVSDLKCDDRVLDHLFVYGEK